MPAGTVLVAVKEFEFPLAEVVLNEKIAVPKLQVEELVEGLTVASTHVVLAPL